MLHKEYRRTPKKNFNENVQKYINFHGLTDSQIDYKLLYQVRNTLPDRIEIAILKNNGYKLFFEEKQVSLRNRHYGYSQKKSYCLLISDGNKSTIIKDYETFLNDYYYNNKIILNDEFKNLDYIAELFGEFKPKKKKIERKQFRFSLTDEEHKIVKEFVKKLKKTLQTRAEKVIIPETKNNNYEEEIIG